MIGLINNSGDDDGYDVGIFDSKRFHKRVWRFRDNLVP